jgi:hypothetical protein
MNYEQLFMALSFSLTFILGMAFGGVIASRFRIYLKISKKEDYEEKIVELDRMIEDFRKETEQPEGMAEKIKAFELFPEDINRDFGLPRELR